MKNLIKLLFVVSTLLLASCDVGAPTDDEGNRILETFGPNFSLLCVHANSTYMRDIDTDIVYYCWTYNRQGGFSVYYNEEGQPMTYAEFKEVHTAKYHAGE